MQKFPKINRGKGWNPQRKRRGALAVYLADRRRSRVSSVALVSHWPLNEASGIRFDAHSANHLTDNNAVLQAAGPIGEAALFDFISSQWLSVEVNPSVVTGNIDFTLCGWVNLTDSTDSRAIAAKYYFDDEQREFMLYYENGSNRFAFLVSSDGTDDFLVFANSLGSPLLGVWYFICAWHDSTADTINIQVDNGPIDSMAHGSGVFAGTAPFELGRDTSAGGRFYWHGRLDSISFFKTVLTSRQRTALYHQGIGRQYLFA